MAATPISVLSAILHFSLLIHYIIHSLSMSSNNNMVSYENMQQLKRLVERLISLKIENLKLTAAQKLTVLLGMTAIAMTGLILGALAITFMSLALARYLSAIMPLYCGYLIVAGILIILFIVILIFRRVILLNPIARFLSRLFFEN